MTTFSHRQPDLNQSVRFTKNDTWRAFLRLMDEQGIASFEPVNVDELCSKGGKFLPGGLRAEDIKLIEDKLIYTWCGAAYLTDPVEQGSEEWSVIEKLWKGETGKIELAAEE